MASPRITIDLTTSEADERQDTSMLDVPELLENIILYLPLRDIVQAQRVSKHWLDSIKSSPRIQQALFLRRSVNISSKLRQTACPVLGLQVADAEGHNQQAYALPTTGVDLIMRPGSTEWIAAQAVDQSSLGNMFVSQPPSYELHIRPDVVGFHAAVRVRNDKGVTVGDVGRKLQEHVRCCGTCKTALNQYARIEYSDRYSTWWPFTWSDDVQRSKLETCGWTVLARMTKGEES
ncbi:hypothetical protein LTS10_011512 [Elasticomyces elasticus]|nr:hypothetical protein LTS10_011512 [Elasticomyces elasticus]